mmetsp:Transcript_21149/g.45897  ORF Transcript_21149/g.45897 Transcript_21149/m.45897 type:complete len:171 (-) Transcript_21149:266-778(-)
MHQYTEDSSPPDPPAANDCADFHSRDLLQNYQHAVECLINCEALAVTLQQNIASKDEQISSLEEKLIQNHASKDTQISNLEEKLIQMSLELASSKTKEDALEHRLSQRQIPSVDFSDDNESSNFQVAEMHGSLSSSFMTGGTVVKRNPSKNRHRRTHLYPGLSSAAPPLV